MEKAARALLGAASGGTFGLVLAGMLRAGFWLAAGIVLVSAAGMAALSIRSKRPGLPLPPRSIWAGICGGAAMLITLGVLLLQSFYIQSASSGGRQPQLPLPIWPVSRVLLWAAVALACLGATTGLAGWAELRGGREKYGGGRFVATALLACGSAIALAAVCYVMGYGLPFGR